MKTLLSLFLLASAFFAGWNTAPFLGSGGGEVLPYATTPVSLTADVTGTLPVENGGTEATTLTDGGVLLGSGTGAITPLAVLGNGEVIVGDGTTDPVALAAFESSTGDLAVTAGGTGVGTLGAGELLVGAGTADITSTTTANLKSSLLLNLVENTALSTWAGSSNLVTLGTITTGTWTGTDIDEARIDWVLTTETPDFGGTASFEIPNAAAPTVDAAGEIAVDTTSSQLVYYGTAKKVLVGELSPAFSYATSTAWTGTTTIPLGTAYVAETWNGVQCFTDTGTLQVSLNDGTNRMDWIQASTTIGTTYLVTNNTFTAAETRYVDVGTPASTPTKISCTI